MYYDGYIPLFLSFRQFLFIIPPFEKKTSTVLCQERFRPREKNIQGSQGSSRYNIEFRLYFEFFNTVIDDGYVGPCLKGHLPQKTAFFTIRFDKRRVNHTHYRQHHTRKSGATSKVDKGSFFILDEIIELGRIQHMTPPGFLDGPPANQIYILLPFFENAYVEFQAPQCFT